MVQALRSWSMKIAVATGINLCGKARWLQGGLFQRYFVSFIKKHIAYWTQGKAECRFFFIYIFRDWSFGPLFCSITTFISHLAIAASVTTMLAIALERSDIVTVWSCALSLYLAALYPQYFGIHPTPIYILSSGRELLVLYSTFVCLS